MAADPIFLRKISHIWVCRMLEKPASEAEASTQAHKQTGRQATLQRMPVDANRRSTIPHAIRNTTSNDHSSP